MRELSVSFGNDGKAILGSVQNLQDEHCAVRLAVTLSEDLLSAQPDEFYLSFVRDADAPNPMPQKLTVGPVTDIREGVLYYELPSSLTNTTCLAVQLEAVRKNAGGEVETLVKSPVFQIRLQASLQGEEALPVTGDPNGLLEKLLDAASQTNAVKEEITAALEQGLYYAKINGHNAVTLQGGRNLSLSDENGVVTIDCSTLPMVSSLPLDPQEGEIVLLLRQNQITTRDTEAELKTGAEMLAAVAAEERRIMTLNQESRCPIYINLRKNGTLVGFVSLTSDWEEDDYGQLNHACVFSFVTKMRGSQPYEGFEIAFVNGAFFTERSNLLHNGTFSSLSAVPSAVRLPAFDTVEEVENEAVSLPVFFTPPSIWVYRSRWLDVTALSEQKHWHGNKATIDCFNCDAVEAAADAPDGQPVIGLAYTGWDRLRWGGGEVRMADDGGVVDYVETVAVGGRTVLRLWLDYGEVQTLYQGAGSRPNYIDIPIDSATASTVTQGGLTLNGTEVDFGIGELEADSHTHTNKAVLDDFDAVNAIGNSGLPADLTRYKGIPTNGYRAKSHIGNFSGYLYACVAEKLATVQTQSITVSGFLNPLSYACPEYILEFTTGATAPTLTLPASVEWVDELTVEANKRYQISILDNIALWCAVDVEVEEE